MRIASGLLSFLYTVIFIALGCLCIALSFMFIPQDRVVELVNLFYAIRNLRVGLGVAGGFLILFGIMIFQLALGKIKRERTIAFDNPDGQVTISLSAIEDFIKRALKQLPDVKELRPFVRAGKKGITIINRVTLFSDVHIPEMTEKIQHIIKTRVQDMLGVEEPVTIKVHVVKIVHKEDPAKDAPKEEKPAQYKGSIEYGHY